MYKQYNKILSVGLSIFLFNTTCFGVLNLFEGKPSASKECERGSWPIFTDEIQIAKLFDPHWEEVVLEDKKGIQKTYYMNLIGLKLPEQVDSFKKETPVDLHTAISGEDIELVPYRQDKKNPKQICHYAFRLKGQKTSLVQIARVDNRADEKKFTRNGLLLTGLDQHLKNLGAALPYLLPALGSTVQAVIGVENAVGGKMPGTQADLENELGGITTPATAAAVQWAQFLDALLGLNDDEDAQVIIPSE